jgi:hypothetical protein
VQERPAVPDCAPDCAPDPAPEAADGAGASADELLRRLAASRTDPLAGVGPLAPLLATRTGRAALTAGLVVVLAAALVLAMAVLGAALG